MANLYLLTDKALDELKKDIKVEKYQQNEPFIEEQFRGRQYKSLIEARIDIADLPELEVKEKSEELLWIQDYKNAIELHKVINSKNVHLRYLVDERFWSYLTHTKYWEYMNKRWYPNDKEHIERNWFFKGGNTVFSRHPLVRLWWRAECSYDERLEDPYELTKVAFDFADPFNQIIERRISKSRKVFKAALIALRDTPNSQKLKGDENRTKFGKAINTIAGVKLIELMSEEELVKMFTEQIDYIVGNK
ncbi:MAG: hypothetical protein IKL68_00935 [Clostridia bacterium]|nr:hypothetical protein [Clostridia bacterium]